VQAGPGSERAFVGLRPQGAGGSHDAAGFPAERRINKTIMQSGPTICHRLIGSFRRLCYVVHGAALTGLRLVSLRACTTLPAARDTSIRRRSLGAPITRSVPVSAPRQSDRMPFGNNDQGASARAGWRPTIPAHPVWISPGRRQAVRGSRLATDDGKRWNLNAQVGGGLTGGGAGRDERASHLRHLSNQLVQGVA
jgi:hypothetical protein